MNIKQNQINILADYNRKHTPYKNGKKSNLYTYPTYYKGLFLNKWPFKIVCKNWGFQRYILIRQIIEFSIVIHMIWLMLMGCSFLTPEMELEILKSMLLHFQFYVNPLCPIQNNTDRKYWNRRLTFNHLLYCCRFKRSFSCRNSGLNGDFIHDDFQSWYLTWWHCWLLNRNQISLYLKYDWTVFRDA